MRNFMVKFWAPAILLIVFLTTFLAINIGTMPPMIPTAQAGPAFDRVIKDRVLRCGYTIYPPLFAKDPNTGEFSGIFHDILEEMAKELAIKVEWTEEVGTDAIFQGLKTGRYDAVCIGYFTTPSRANGGDFTKPAIYIPTYIYVQADDKRFQSFDDLNTPNVKMGTMDGEYSDILRKQRFPETQAVSLIGLSSAAERFELVAAGKADFTVAEANLGLGYIANNPGKLKSFGPPISTGGSTIIVPHDEYPLVAYLNAGIDNLLLSGKLSQIVEKYQNHPGEFLLPRLPYQKGPDLK